MLRSVVNVIFVLVCESLSLAAWLFYKLVDCVVTPQSVVLPTGVAFGVQRATRVVFKNVRYATAKRFCAPVPLPESTTRVLNEPDDVVHRCFAQTIRAASLESPIPVHALHAFWAKRSRGYIGSEDAHTLDIYVPRTAGSRRPLPVLLFFHGGGFVFGDKCSSWWSSPSRSQNFILVTAAYRLGVFGYLAASGAVSNCGTRDQIAALQWVRDNIRRFGGDPERICVGGQSAGAISVGALLSVPAAAAMMRRAFLSSGTGLHVCTSQQSKDVATMLARECALAGGPSAVDDGTLVKHLAALPTGALLRLQKRVEDRIAIAYRECTYDGLLPFAPSIDNELFRHGKEQLAAPVPLLVGTTLHEYLFFTQFQRKSWAAIDEAKMAARVRQWVGHLDFGSEEAKAAAAANLVAAYTRDDAGEASPAFRRRFPPAAKVATWAALNGDFVFRMPSELVAARMTARFGAPAFVYVFCEPSGLMPALGAHHVIDAHFHFNSPLSFPYMLGLPSLAQLRLAHRCAAALDAFVCLRRDEDLAAALWQPFDAATRATMYWTAADGSCGVRRNQDEVELRAWEPIAEAMLNAH